MSNPSNRLERLTVTLPKSLLEAVEERLIEGHYATATEWIRHAIREQLSREKSPMEQLIERDPRVLESLEQARRGEIVEFDIQRFIENLKQRKAEFEARRAATKASE